jgi:hypothetical protein
MALSLSGRNGESMRCSLSRTREADARAEAIRLALGEHVYAAVATKPIPHAQRPHLVTKRPALSRCGIAGEAEEEGAPVGSGPGGNAAAR